MRQGRQSAPARTADPHEGVLLVDKPSGPTSHDVVDRIRRHFKIRKVGHGGTLDPMATGLLIILLGRGTKLSNVIMGSDKTYEGTMRLGASTNTEDGDGEITSESPFDHITKDQVLGEMRKLTGDVMQTPPMVSAIKKNGVPLYKLARKGKTVEREPRLIHIYEFSMQEFAPPEVTFKVRCTKGTYVRTLCSDVGNALGCGAYLQSLRRTESGSMSVDNALTMKELLELDIKALGEKVIPIHQVLAKEMSA